MTDWVLTLVEHNGAGILFLMTLLASLALPVPASFGLLAAGAFSATGDLALPAVGASAFAGAVLGDLSAYGIGRWGGARLWDRLQQRPKAGRMLTEARDMLHRHAGTAVLLSRWPFSPLGPYVNAVSGATRLAPVRFGLLCATGNAVWITLYLTLGHTFAARFKDVGHILSLGVTALALAAVIVALAVWARRSIK
jgi:membrane protein DedA with SNARE-associated domain